VEIEARRAREPGFSTPVLARPLDLVTLNETPLRGPEGAPLTSARRSADGALEPYAERRAIEDGPGKIANRPWLSCATGSNCS